MTRNPAPIFWLLAAISCFATSCHAAPPEVRGTWITTTANTHIATP